MQRCIFCKFDSTCSTSIEHIIPESLGNVKHTLPKGIVCDKCNNYFARELEGKVLSSGIIQKIRSSMSIPTKKGKIPSLPSNNIDKLPEYRTMARFLGKIGLEVLTQRAISIINWEKEIIDKVELDMIRNFVRFNKSDQEWLFSYRTLHPINAVFLDGKEYYEVLHEYDLLYTKSFELFIVISIFGVEFSLNLGGPEIEGYFKWLAKNNSISPLYRGKNKSGQD